MESASILLNEQLLIALIAGGAALLGSAVGQLGPLVQHWLATKHERQVVVRQRYEQMATLAGELAIILSGRLDRLNEAAASTRRELLQCAIQMHTLALLYFPEIEPKMEALRLAAIRMDTAMQKPVADDVAVAVEAFAQARRAATQAIQEHASRYT